MNKVDARRLGRRTADMIREVRAGHPVQIVESGKAVAVVMPVAREGFLAGLEAEGRLRRARGSLADLPPPLPPKPGLPLPSRILARLRGER